MRHCTPGTLALPPRVCAGSAIVLLAPSAGLGTVLLKPSAAVVTFGQADRVVLAALDDVEVRNDAPLTGPNPIVPRPVVPRPAVPRPVVPASEFAVGIVEVPELAEDEEDDKFAAVSELFEELMTPDAVVPELKELTTPVLPTDAVLPKFEELMIPVLLTELHGVDAVVAPRAAGTPDTVAPPAFVERVIPPPSNVGRVAELAIPIEHGVAFAAPE